jgi:AcrR family transcriptional regulator
MWSPASSPQTFEELSRVGYAGMRAEDVAARAGVNKTTCYRRWSTKAELLTNGVIEHAKRPEPRADPAFPAVFAPGAFAIALRPHAAIDRPIVPQALSAANGCRRAEHAAGQTLVENRVAGLVPPQCLVRVAALAGENEQRTARRVLLQDFTSAARKARERAAVRVHFHTIKYQPDYPERFKGMSRAAQRACSSRSRRRLAVRRIASSRARRRRDGRHRSVVRCGSGSA